MQSITITELTPDIQNLPDTRGIAIQKVGIKNLKHPIKILMRDGSIQMTIAIVDMFVQLRASLKGCHMSRFIEVLNATQKPFTASYLYQLLKFTAEQQNSDAAFINLSYPIFILKQAPVSKIESLMDYQVKIEGIYHPNNFSIHYELQVPITSLCPCSKAISKYGAHNQRSIVTLNFQSTVEVWMEDIIELIEKESSCELYGVLKRPDEKYITEKAYENPKFVEDIVRDIAIQLKKLSHITHFKVEVENLESIHNHSAYAQITNP
ncbi:MAG: hypothetical protein JWM09_899 [Francisellaceae bacterium]|nr:hypothetical protein [Francisellaceae bacterium]